MKECACCHIEKDFGQYIIDGRCEDGYSRLCVDCKILPNDYISKSRHKEIVMSYRKQCLICSEDDWSVLCFHHLYDKSFDVCNYNKKVNEHELLLEISKCVVLCTNCHMKYHIGKRFSILPNQNITIS